MKDKERIKLFEETLTKMTDDFCREHIDEEYAELCRAMIKKMGRKRMPPFFSGKIEIWAGAIIYAIGAINFLFDKKVKPHLPPDAICEYFGTSKSTTRQKAKVILDMFKMGYYDAEFSTKRMADRNPYKNMAMLNGFLVMLDR